MRLLVIVLNLDHLLHKGFSQRVPVERNVDDSILEFIVPPLNST
jgi:hypothetical protein